MKAKLDFFKKALSCVLVAGVSFACSTANAQTTVIDDFSGALAGYTQVEILDNGPAGGSGVTSTFSNNADGLILSTTGSANVQQIALIHDGTSLSVGDEVQLDILGGSVTGNRNFGLYVGGTQPVDGTRQDYISIYGGSDSNATRNRIFQRGFDGTSEWSNESGDPASGIADTLFIALTAPNTFEAGFYDSTGRVVVETLVPGSDLVARPGGVANSAEFVGIYADVRANGTLGTATELRIVTTAVPEPSSLALLGLASIAGLARRRKR